MKALIAGAPTFAEHMDAESAEHFATLQALLQAAGVEYAINPRLVRGLDYYSRTVFEWVTDRLGAQGTVCAGGRYDGLIEIAGGRPTPAVGFAMGVERLIALLQADNVLRIEAQQPQIYVMPLEAGCVQPAMGLAEKLRDATPPLRVQLHCGSGSIKSQMKRADHSGARFAVLIGADEMSQDAVTIKPLRGEGAQCMVPASEAAGWLQVALAN
jgi:histidyl-tRNA synthetase